MLWVEEVGVPGGTGFSLTVEERGEGLVATLADWFQDQVFPESRGAWGEPGPACPGHRHPAVAELVAGQAVWICPVDKRPIARIGELPVTPPA